jgi:hypothetical protein
MLGKFYPMRKGGKKYFWETGQQGRKLRLQRGQHHNVYINPGEQVAYARITCSLIALIYSTCHTKRDLTGKIIHGFSSSCPGSCAFFH